MRQTFTTNILAKIAIWITLVCAVSAHAAAQQQAVSTQGRDFWLMFLTNGSTSFSVQRSIIVASAGGATVNVEAPRTGWSRQVTVAAGESKQVAVPRGDLGYHVTASADISVYASNYMAQSHDIATVFPTPVLRSHYLVQTYEEDGQVIQDSEVGIVAVEDSTVVTLRSFLGQEYRCTLMAGETRIYSNNIYHPDSLRIEGPLTGSRIEAAGGKRLAVFQGNVCTPVGPGSCDHLYEQAVPTDYWGREFIVVPIARRENHDWVKVTSLADTCRVLVNDTEACVLSTGASHLIQRSDVFRISTSRPVTVCLYLSGNADSTSGPSLGDPSSVIIPPVEQGMRRITFQAIATAHSTLHYANVVAQTCGLSTMRLDGNLIDTLFKPLNGSYSYAQLLLTPGSHTLADSTGLFQAYIYGMGDDESYAYVAGMAMADFIPELCFNGETSIYEAHLCAGDSATAELHIGNGFSDTRWRLDGVELENTSLRLPLHFDSVGTHTLQALLHGSCCREWCDSLQVTLHVHPSNRSIRSESQEYFCKGTPYHWHDTVILEPGYYIHSETDMYGCDSLLALRLDSIAVPQFDIDVETNVTSYIYRLTAMKHDTLHWSTLWWSSTPHDPRLYGHESDYSITVAPEENTVYRLHVAEQCSTSQSVTLDPLKPSGYYVPNTFTPDADRNKRFAFVSEHALDGELSIYDRSGHLMYRTDKPTEGWDGTHDGQPCPQGVYVWFLHYRYLYSAREYHAEAGTVTLLR